MTKHLLRVALFLPMYTRDPSTNEIRALGTGGVFVDIVRSLAARTRTEVRLMSYEVPGEAVESLRSRACDVAFMGVERARTVDVDFSPPVVHVDFSYLVPAGSPIKSIPDADRQGMRIAVVRNHLSTLALSRLLTRAEQIGSEVPDAAFDLLRTGRADVFASVRPALAEYSAKLPGSAVLEDSYGFNPMVIAIAKGQAERLACISEFVEEAKVSGFVQRAIERAGVHGVHVAPAGELDSGKDPMPAAHSED